MMSVKSLEVKKTHIFFLIRSLDVGGTERQLIELVKGLDKSKFKITVALFYEEGELRKDLLRVNGVTLLSLNKSGRWDLLRFGYRLIKTLKQLKPDILYSFLSEANIAGLVAGVLAGVKRIVWGVRSSNMDVSRYDWLAGVSLRLCAFLSRYPDVILVNSFAGLKFHKDIGYKIDRMKVIANGIDTKHFKPDPQSGLRVRDEWGVDRKTILIGLVGRLDPMKDHSTFLRATKIFIQQHDSVKFVCVGDGPHQYKGELHALSEELGLADCLMWVGTRYDMPAVYNALDIATSSSFSEGFQNVVGEAMACGVPCVVTDVGDSNLIVGETSIVVPHSNPQALAEGWQTMLQELQDDPFSAGERTRARIVAQFSSEIFVQRTSDALSGLL